MNILLTPLERQKARELCYEENYIDDNTTEGELRVMEDEAIAQAAARKVVQWAEQWQRDYDRDGFGELRGVTRTVEALKQEVGP